MDIKKMLRSEHIEVNFLNIDVNGDLVKKIRKENNLTQATLANILGVSKRTIENWEQRKSNIKGSSAVLIRLLVDNPEIIEKIYNISFVKNNKNN